MDKSKLNTGLRIFGTLLLGAAAGLAAGYLTAPRSGWRTRNRIVKDFDTAKHSLESAAERKLQEAKSLLNMSAKKVKSTVS